MLEVRHRLDICHRLKVLGRHSIVVERVQRSIVERARRSIEVLVAIVGVELAVGSIDSTAVGVPDKLEHSSG